MSKAAATIDEQMWFNKHEAAEYMQRLGFRDFTYNSVKTAARSGKLHTGRPEGKAYYWHKDWLDDWAAGVSRETLDDNAIDDPANNWEE